MPRSAYEARGGGQHSMTTVEKLDVTDTGSFTSGSTFGAECIINVRTEGARPAEFLVFVDTGRSRTFAPGGVARALRAHTWSHVAEDWLAPLSVRAFTESLGLRRVGTEDPTLEQLQELAWGDSVPEPDDFRPRFEVERPSVATARTIATIADRTVKLAPLKMEFEDEGL